MSSRPTRAAATWRADRGSWLETRLAPNPSGARKSTLVRGKGRGGKMMMQFCNYGRRESCPSLSMLRRSRFADPRIQYGVVSAATALTFEQHTPPLTHHFGSKGPFRNAWSLNGGNCPNTLQPT